jgi:hypothetical protein
MNGSNPEGGGEDADQGVGQEGGGPESEDREGTGHQGGDQEGLRRKWIPQRRVRMACRSAKPDRDVIAGRCSSTSTSGTPTRPPLRPTPWCRRWPRSRLTNHRAVSPSRPGAVQRGAAHAEGLGDPGAGSPLARSASACLIRSGVRLRGLRCRGRVPCALRVRLFAARGPSSGSARLASTPRPCARWSWICRCPHAAWHGLALAEVMIGQHDVGGVAAQPVDADDHADVASSRERQPVDFQAIMTTPASQAACPNLSPSRQQTPLRGCPAVVLDRPRASSGDPNDRLCSAAMSGFGRIVARRLVTAGRWVARACDRHRPRQV